MRPVLPLLLPALAAALLVGCGGADEDAASPQQTPEPTETAPATDTGDEGEPIRLRVYLMRGEHVAVAARDVEATEAPGRAALEALLAGPSDVDAGVGLTSAIPDGTELRSLAIEDGHATVDLSRTFESGGGSLSMQARVAQVVYTLTQFPTVDSVSIRLDGEDVDGIGGEGVPASDLTRRDFEDLTPAILVESPAPGDRVASPLRIQGTANTFEANFQVRIVDGGGHVVHEGFVTATSGSGERGTFDETITLEEAQAGTGTLIVFEESAADGSVQNLVEVPLELAP